MSLKDGRSISPAAPAAKVRVSPATHSCALTQEMILLKKGAWPHNCPALSQEGGRGGCDRCITRVPLLGKCDAVANSLQGSRSQPCRCGRTTHHPSPPRSFGVPHPQHESTCRIEELTQALRSATSITPNRFAWMSPAELCAKMQGRVGRSSSPLLIGAPPDQPEAMQPNEHHAHLRHPQTPAGRH